MLQIRHIFSYVIQQVWGLKEYNKCYFSFPSEFETDLEIDKKNIQADQYKNMS